MHFMEITCCICGYFCGAQTPSSPKGSPFTRSVILRGTFMVDSEVLGRASLEQVRNKLTFLISKLTFLSSKLTFLSSGTQQPPTFITHSPYKTYGDSCMGVDIEQGPTADAESSGERASERFPWISLRSWLVTPELQWQSRGE